MGAFDLECTNCTNTESVHYGTGIVNSFLICHGGWPVFFINKTFANGKPLYYNDSCANIHPSFCGRIYGAKLMMRW